jgi:hypothetical protein
MISRRSARRAAVVTAVTLVPLAVFGGVGLAHGKPSASQYQYGPSGHQYGKVTVCHATGSKKHPWHAITVSMQAWNHGHMKHSHKGNKDFLVDSTHPCPPVTGLAPTVTTTHGNSGNHGNHGKGNDDNQGNDSHGNNGNNGHHGKP